MRPRSAYDRMMDKVVKPDGEAGCWLFTGCKGNEYGHGQVRAKKNGKWKKEWAHRLAYEHHIGPIPKHMVVRHKCDVANCVAPHHFELGTVAQNNYDIAMRQRGANGYGPYTSFVETTESLIEEACPF